MIWISHRGCSPFLENSREAFDLAVQENFDFLETDLRLSGSGEIVLSHDGNLQRLWGKTQRLSEISTKEFLGLRGPEGEHPLDFPSFAEAYPNQRWVLDIKGDSAPGVLDALRHWTQQTHKSEFLSERCRFLLWNLEHESLLRSWLPRAECFPGERQCWRAGLAAIAGMPGLGNIEPNRTYSLPPQVWGISLYRPQVVDAFHRRGARVLAFLPSEPMFVKGAMRCGIDEILIDGKRSLVENSLEGSS